MWFQPSYSTVLLGLLLFPCSWGIFFWWYPTLSCRWLFSSVLQFWSSHRRWAHIPLLSASKLLYFRIPFPRGFYHPVDRTQISCIVGGFFTSWATRKAQEYWSGQLIHSPGDFPYPGIKLGSPALQADSLPTELSGKSRERNHIETHLLLPLESELCKYLGERPERQTGCGSWSS